MKRALERRFTPGEVSVRMMGASSTIEGHAAVFRSLSQDLGGFVEQVNQGAFTKTLQESDVRALFNHDPNMPLGRNKANTVELSQDASGLYYRITPPDTSYARDLMVSMERGDVNQSSFSFSTIEDGWSLTPENFPLRSLVQVQLYDVGPVTFPAYLGADSGLGRSAALAGLSKRSGLEIEELDDEAIRRIVTGEPADKDSAGSSTEALDPWALRAQYAKWLERQLSATS